VRRTRTRRRKEHGRNAPPRRRAPLWPAGAGAAWPRLLNHLIRLRDRDLTFWQILEDLGLGEDRADSLREQMALLEKAGLLAHHRRGRFRLRSRDRLVVGRLSIPDRSREIGRHWGASGAFGFVSTADAEGDLYLPARGIAGARHGDTVLARVVGARRAGRTQGEVVAVVQRAPSRFGGEVIESEGRLRIRPRDDRRAREVVLVDPGRAPGRLESEEGHRRGAAREQDGAGDREEAVRPEPGDLVVADLDEERPDRARIVQVIGPADAPDAAERLVRAEMELPGEFPPEVEEEAARAGTDLRPEDLEGRTDFRSRVTLTIDPVDARDFDDAVGLEHLEGGAVRLWVHIADVARYVLPGTALDREALARGTSVYFPSSVIPMIPHSLSSGICSLREGEDRLVQSVGIDYTRDAEVRAVCFADGVIRSTARLSYEEAAAAMEDPVALANRGEAGREVVTLLTSLAPLARRLTRKRVRRGALDLDLPEVEFDPGKEGIPVALRARERTDAHRLIEEFMLAANEAVARHLSERESPSLHRVHEPPDPRDVEEVEKSLAGLGLRRARSGTLAARMQRILSTFRGRPGELIIARHLLRAMKLARYAAAPAGHFGLALSHYTHFTSPIRRYPDLIVHRILRADRRAAGDGAAGGQDGSGTWSPSPPSRRGWSGGPSPPSGPSTIFWWPG
jgi:ribonuclease R